MEKASGFGLPFFYRAVFPGAVFVLVLSPLLARVIHLAADPLQIAGAWAAVAVFAGIAIAALDDPIFEVFEGRRLWPNWLYGVRRRRWLRQVEREYARTTDLSPTDWRLQEVWNDLRRFPLDEAGRPTATRPTKLGNLLASCEDYSMRAYGMHAVAYWERIWLCVSKDDREEIDHAAALTDGWTYVAGVLLFVGAFYLFASLVSATAALAGLQVFLAPDEQVAAGYGGATLMLLSFLPYAISLPGHARAGENMKAMFDLYRDRLGRIAIPASDADRAEAQRIGEWLVYGFGAPVPPSGQTDIDGWTRMLSVISRIIKRKP